MKRALQLLLILFFNFLAAQEGSYEILNTSINSKFAELGVTYSGNNSVIFASSKKDNSGRRTNNRQLSLELYQGLIAENGDIIQTDKFSKEINNKFFESDIAFTPDFKTIYFTWNNFYSALKSKDSAKWKTLYMFKASINEKFELSNVTPLPFNSKEYSVRSPRVSNDGKKLYFVSDMPGGFGETDIYVVNINNEGNYGTPKNLGSSVNTKLSELFPYIDQNNTLYFSSNGHKGKGGLDIFKSEFIDGNFQQAENLSAPFNGKYDDFAFVIDNASNSGYFTSDRDGGKGDVDIYAFKEKCLQTITILTLNESNEQPLEKVSVSLFQNNKLIEKQTISKNSSYKFNVNCKESYKIIAEKENFETAELSIITDEKYNAETTKSLKLTSKECTQLLSGTVLDDETNLPLSNAIVTIYKGKELLGRLNLDANATFKYKLLCGSKYKITVSLKDYHENFSEVETSNQRDESLNLTLKLESSVEFVSDHDQKMIKTKTINFDLNQSSIRLDAAIELNKVIAILRKYPSLKIEIKSHTDSRASADYNMKLTNNRAKKVIAYIVANGIDQGRVSGRGYGETQLVNNCAKGVKCTEAEHQMNRRTEFIIREE